MNMNININTMSITNNNTTNTPIENLKQNENNNDNDNDNLNEYNNIINYLENSEVTKKINLMKISDDSTPNRPQRDTLRSFNEIKDNNDNDNDNNNNKNNLINKSLKKNKNGTKENKKKFRVKFNKELVQIISVESFKKYNIDVSSNESNFRNGSKSSCLIY